MTLTLANNFHFQDDAKAALVEQCVDLTKLSTFDGSWSSVEFVRTYPKNNPKDKYVNSIRANAVLVYVNTSLEEDGIKANINVLFYLGVSVFSTYRSLVLIYIV